MTIRLINRVTNRLTNIGTLLIRADASVATGTGHVMRCLALAQAWQDASGQVIFAAAEITDALRERLGDEGCTIESVSSPGGSSADATQTVAFAQAHGAAWVVVDGYVFGSQYQRPFNVAGVKTLFLDDHGRGSPYSANVVLNQNVGANRDLYTDRDPQTRLLLGTRYCLLRREFARWRSWHREISSTCSQLLVLMGGSDPENVTARVLEALATDEFKGLATTVVVGGSNPNFAILKSLAGSWPNIILRKNVTAMGELIASADIAISASGATCWELCCLGLPSLLVDVADNQKPIATELDRRGCALHIGDWSVTLAVIQQRLRELVGSVELRQSLAFRSRELVDGRGAERAISAMRGTPLLCLRRAAQSDAPLLWEWANDPEVRAASFSSSPIPWEAHVAWLADKVDPSKTLFLIAEEEDGSSVGQVRFDLSGNEAELNFSIAKEHRGLGRASPLIESAVLRLWADTTTARVHAFVKAENIASAKAFEKTGFERIGSEQVRGKTATHFIRVRS